MARKVQVDLVDDIDGGQADETMRFGLDGANYEIDLSARHAEKLRASLAKYILASRRISRSTAAVAIGRRVAGTPARTDPAQNQAIRDWAKNKGIEISDRGRIPAHIAAQYQAEAGR
jgi:nucleoid-associated protein Lsr2